MDMEKKVFGSHLKEYNIELKGSKLLQKETFKWALNYTEDLPLNERQKHVRRFLTAVLEKSSHKKRLLRLWTGSASLRPKSVANPVQA